MKNLLFLFCLLLTGINLYGQNGSIRGIVRDSSNDKVLEEATISVMALPDTTLIRRIRSSSNGFAIGRLEKGDYMLVTSYLGFKTDSLYFSVGGKHNLKSNFVIRIAPVVQRMTEVVVRAVVPPLIIRNDTFSFSTLAYPSPPNTTLEDFIKKLPGAQVDKDGKVTMQGKPVDKILIDGKEFYIGDLRTATQHLPTDIIAQVEVFDTRSERDKLLGIKGISASKTINIKLKKSKRLGSYGDMYIGGGNNSAYSLGGSSTLFAQKQWLFGSLNANNINNQFTGKENSNGPGEGIQKMNDIVLNYRREWGSALKMVIDGGREQSDGSVQTAMSRQTILTDSSIIQNTISTNNSNNTGYHINGRAEWAVDSLTQIYLTSNYSNQKTMASSSDSVAITTVNTYNEYLSSLGRTINTGDALKNSWSNNISFYRRLKKQGRSIGLNFSKDINNLKQPAATFSLIRNFDSLKSFVSSTTINQQSQETTKNSGYNLNASYTEPVGKHYILDFSYEFSQSGGHSIKESYNYDSLTEAYDLLDSFTTSRFVNSEETQRVNANFNSLEGKYNFQIGMSVQKTLLTNTNQISGQVIEQKPLNLIPRISVAHEIVKGKSLSFSYNSSTRNPTIDQLQPVPDLSNPYLIHVGNPDLKQELSHELQLAYSGFNPKTFQNLMIMLNGNFNQNHISSSSTVLPGGIQEIKAVNVNGFYRLNAMMIYGFPLWDQKHGNASINLNSSYGRDISIVNQQTNVVDYFGISCTAKANYHATDKLFIDVEGAVAFSHSSYSLNLAPTTETLSESYRVNATWRLPLSFILTSYYNLSFTGQQNAVPSTTVSLWNVAVSKAVFRNHTGEVRFSVFDLLNNANNFYQSRGVDYIQTVRTNHPGRFVLLSFIWRFNKFEGQPPG